MKKRRLLQRRRDRPLSSSTLQFSLIYPPFPRLSSLPVSLQILASSSYQNPGSSVLIPTMATGNKGRQLPKFGEWDATNNPGAAQGFTVIFNNARDDKKTKKTAVAGPESLVTPPINNEPPQNNNHNHNHRHHRQKQNNNNHREKRNSPPPREKKKWLCFL